MTTDENNLNESISTSGNNPGENDSPLGDEQDNIPEDLKDLEEDLAKRGIVGYGRVVRVRVQIPLQSHSNRQPNVSLALAFPCMMSKTNGQDIARSAVGRSDSSVLQDLQ